MMIIKVFRNVSNLQQCSMSAQQVAREFGNPGTFPVSRRMKAIVNIKRKTQLANIVWRIFSKSSRWFVPPSHFTVALKSFLAALSPSVGGQRKAKVRTA